MALSKNSKKEILKDLIVKLKECKGVVLTDYQGMNVFQITCLRNELKEKKVEFKIVKNTLIEKACEELNIKDLTKDLIGCTALPCARAAVPAWLPAVAVLSTWPALLVAR